MGKTRRAKFRRFTQTIQWMRLRIEAFERYGFNCSHCGGTEKVEPVPSRSFNNFASCTVKDVIMLCCQCQPKFGELRVDYLRAWRAKREPVNHVHVESRKTSKRNSRVSDVRIDYVKTLEGDERKRYYKDFYLHSDHWRDLRAGVISAYPRCELCQAPSYDIHHLVYRHLFDVTFDDLRAVCRECHDEIHLAIKEKRIVYKFSDEPIIRWRKTRIALGYSIDHNENQPREHNVAVFGH